MRDEIRPPVITTKVFKHTLQKLNVIASFENVAAIKWIEWTVDQAFKSLPKRPHLLPQPKKKK